jgi:hypothetical protein
LTIALGPHHLSLHLSLLSTHAVIKELEGHTLRPPFILSNSDTLLPFQLPDRPQEVQPMSDARHAQLLEGSMVHRGEDVAGDLMFYNVVSAF